MSGAGGRAAADLRERRQTPRPAADPLGADAARVHCAAVLRLVRRRHQGFDFRQPGHPRLCRYQPEAGGGAGRDGIDSLYT